MGVNLRREPFLDWLKNFEPEERAVFLTRLEAHVGQKLNLGAWQVKDDAYPRVGGYTSYNVFRFCLEYVTRGEPPSWPEEPSAVEREALEEFRARLKPAAVEALYAAHFLETGDTDTMFIPILFAQPLSYEGIFVASLPGAILTLEAFAKGLGFDLTATADVELEGGRWLAIANAKSVAKILYGFFTQKPDACVLLA
jgi:hypothetical protein